MNFDDEDIEMDFGYTPTIAKGSRSASMKKLTRKNQNKPAPKKQVKNNDDFDMLDDLLGPDPPKKTTEPKNNMKKSYGADSIDSFFDDPSPKKPETKKSINIQNNKIKNTSLNIQKQPLTFNQDPIEEFTKPSSLKLGFDTKPPIASKSLDKKQQKIEDDTPLTISPSLRNMRPPLKKKQSKDSIKLETASIVSQQKHLQKIFSNGLGLTISEEGDDKKSVTSKDREQKIKIEGRKKISIQNRQPQLKLSLQQPPKINQNLRQPSSLTIQDSIMINDEPSFKPVNKSQLKINKVQAPKNQVHLRKKDQLKQPPSLAYDTRKIAQKTQKISLQYPSISAALDDQRELDFIKQSYEKHINSLQKNLQDQIKINKQSRENLMNQCNNLIKMERNRLQKLHNEQILRIKQILTWQKTKMQENYKLQVESLKKQAEDLKFRHQYTQNNGTTQQQHPLIETQRKQIKYQQQKLRMQRRSLQDKQKFLDKRQYELQERQRQFMKRKKLDEQRIRDEQRRIFQNQQQSKKNILSLRRNIESQKHDIASEAAQIQLQNQRRSQKMRQTMHQLENQRQNLKKEKQQMRKLNKKILEDLKLKQQQMRQKQTQLKNVETDLINKIKVIKARSAQINAEQTNPKINTTLFEKQNKTNIANFHQALKRPLSAHHRKDQNQKRVIQTQTRFFNISQSIQQGLKQTNPKTQFNLDKYLMDMAKYTRKY